MATAYLTSGATSLAAGSWSDAAGFAAAAELVISDGAQTITTALDQAAGGDIRFLRIGPQYAGVIGSGSNPLITDATDGTAAEWTSAVPNEGRIVHGGSRTIYLQTSAGGVSNYHHMGPGTTEISAGTVSFAKAFGGQTNIGPSTIVTNQEVHAGASVFLDAGAGTIATLSVFGGACVCRRPASSAINLYGGTLTLDITSGTTPAVNHFGGTLILLSGSTITAYVGRAGTLNVNQLRRDTTITTFTHGAGLAFSARGGGATLTVTNDVKTDEATRSI